LYLTKKKFNRTGGAKPLQEIYLKLKISSSNKKKEVRVEGVTTAYKKIRKQKKRQRK